MSDVLERLRSLRLVPVVVIDDAEAAVPLARALVDGGLPCAEITFRTAAAAEAIRRITVDVPDMLVGAGTVLSPEQARTAAAAGATFIVSPGFNPRVVDHCNDAGIPIFPGVCTPTEVESALDRGLRTVKFFPAEAMGGIGYLKAIAAPYADVEFIPTGGIGLEQLPAYLSFRRVAAVGGSWMVSREWITSGAFDRVRDAVAAAVDATRNLG
ncbi:MAG TPA: bifunctional 4-hydroxy-2-oxoglutarate aldolase/2-dehydro-3-deoxy-phosphogluconate aldolase [Longimicrobiales bacterium]|nr:bifunctional 4-hydroxy-2-oxoglutarate aldolase/2-dehydro-3-deoxy-phosphogluconate aldolase [Longimicrobiales bacterium]